MKLAVDILVHILGASLFIVWWYLMIILLGALA